MVPRSKGDILVPPENFALVERGLYRGAFPKPKNFPFLRTLGLRTILSLKLEKTNEYPAANTAFNHEHGIQLLMFGMPGNKEPFVDIPEDGIAAALAAVLDPRCHPMYVHCNKGKHRTGCLVGCLRKVQRWSLVAIFEEYRRFAGSKARVVDQHFIERFQPSAGAARAGALPGALPARALEPEPEGVEPGGAG